MGRNKENDDMKDAEQTLKEVVATMELSGFNISDEEKKIVLQGIRGERAFDSLKAEALNKIKEEISKECSYTKREN